MDKGAQEHMTNYEQIKTTEQKEEYISLYCEQWKRRVG
jgi:hypothetical protein